MACCFSLPILSRVAPAALYGVLPARSKRSPRAPLRQERDFRIAIHFFNTRAKIDAAIQAIVEH